MKIEQQTDQDKNPPPLTAREEWSEFMKTALIAVVLAMLIRTFLYEPFHIPSSSMKPTLEIGDYLFVSKPAYGFSNHSFPLGLQLFEGRVMAKDRLPLRGDVVVFFNEKTKQDYIKRVIGLPGDRVQVKHGELYLNGEKVLREVVGLKKIREGYTDVVLTEYTQTLPEGAMFSIYEQSDRQPLDDTEEYHVPEGHYFMMGDNRDHSQDSRVLDAVGYVPFENIIGRASFIFFSTDGSASLAEVWKWPFAVRYGRIFDRIAPVRPPQEKTAQKLTREAQAAKPEAVKP